MMNKIRYAVGALVFRKNQLLLVRKVMMMDVASGPQKIEPLWGFPIGGLKESDKDNETAVLREVAEEIGSDELTIVDKLPDFNFNFSEDVAGKIGFSSQVTSMFLIRLEGDVNHLYSQDEEIDSVSFFSKEGAIKQVTFDNSKEYISAYFK